MKPVVTTEFIETSDTVMQKKMEDSYLMGTGSIVFAGAKNPTVVFPFDQDPPVGWDKKRFSTKPKVEVDVLLSAKYMSYVLFTIDGTKFCVPLDDHVQLLRAVVGSRIVGFTRSTKDMETKGSRRKYEKRFQLPKAQATGLYHGILLFQDMQKKLKEQEK